jgi:hypothetical protein
MFEIVKQSGTAWRTLRRLEDFERSLTEDQKALLSEVKTSLRGMSKGVVPDDIRPVVDYVLADDGESTMIKAIGAVMHPAVKSSLAGIKGAISPDSHGQQDESEPFTVVCRNCGFVAQYGLTEHE